MSVVLYDSKVSGNCYKVRLLFALLGIDYERRELSVVDKSNREDELGDLNPGLRVPTVVLDDGRPLGESGAILWYFADGTQFVPTDPFERAKVLQWMFFEQYSHEPYVATPRYIVKHFSPDHERRAELPDRLAKGRAALAVMEQHLRLRTFFVAERYTIADIALYAYTHVAHEGGHDLTSYPSIRSWLTRVAAEPNHTGIYVRPNG